MKEKEIHTSGWRIRSLLVNLSPQVKNRGQGLPLTPFFKPHKHIFEVFTLLGDLLGIAPKKCHLWRREKDWVGFGLGLRVSSSKRHDCWRMLVGTSERDMCLLNKSDAFSKTIFYETDVVIRFQRRFWEKRLWKVAIIYKNVTTLFFKTIIV